MIEIVTEQGAREGMKKVLLIEDERNFARFIELELRHESFDVGIAYDGETGLRLATTDKWDVILLDLMLPGVDGLEVCRRIREAGPTPIIMITARDRVSDRVEGLDSGADDYLPKPFAIEELLARMRVIFRRQEHNERSNESPLLAVGELTVDRETREVKRGGTPIELTRREYALLVAFMEHANRVMERERLLDQVWGFDTAVDTNVVDVYVRYLRNKIDRPGEPSLIETVRGVGYVMRR